MASYWVGIDLGTSHTVVAYQAIGADQPAQLFPICQLVGPGSLMQQAKLPSVRYHPASDELAEHDCQLPWSASNQPNNKVIIGEWARQLGLKTSHRAVVSAKSWLSHSGIDRTADILPWQGAADMSKISPLAASASYLDYVRQAWNQQFPQQPLERQSIVLTIPASFDEAARAYTLEAARLAGLSQLTLLEEPQAACYHWLTRNKGQLASLLADKKLLLVCDIGGGTTDFSLLSIHSDPLQPRFERIAVGTHLLLGGDNMDLALARIAEQRLGQSLTNDQWSQLLYQSRLIKEQLLADEAPDSATLTLLGGGRRLVGGARSLEFSRQQVQDDLLKGFFPQVSLDARPLATSGLVEMGLPYPADAAISRHLAAFLMAHQSGCRHALGLAEQDRALPDCLLLNGGVCHSPTLSQALVDMLAQWRQHPVELLANSQPDFAVALGAVAYGISRQQGQTYISGGSARSFFLQLASSKGQGSQTQPQAVCLLPKGTVEQQEVLLADRQFALKVNQPVRFHVLATTDDQVYQPGQLVDSQPHWLSLPPLLTVIKTDQPGKKVAVQLASKLNTLGVLDMHCVDCNDDQQRWQLSFAIRQGIQRDEPAKAADKLSPKLATAQQLIEQVYGSAKVKGGEQPVRTLRQGLEQLFGPRNNWDLALSRALYDLLWQGQQRRRRSADHERLWFNLTGYCLRPGLGDPLDSWRVEQLWPLYSQRLQFTQQLQNNTEWWVFWRRVSGGLSVDQQTRLYQDVSDELVKGANKKAQSSSQAIEDKIRLLAVLEHLPSDNKATYGDWLIKQLKRSLATASIRTKNNKGKSSKTQSSVNLLNTYWWALARVGTRLPLYGSAHQLVSQNKIAQWLDYLLTLDWRKVAGAGLTASLLARKTGDRQRDIDAALAQQVVKQLKARRLPQAWLTGVQQMVAPTAKDQQSLLGESLPAGLSLIK